ncbi:unnamed protein product [Symbiodinium natans]|uniref:Uncharacterized protein n=1 Tax=Symbiodinium natans TaxID=878477 RepID=A0A812UQX5_9DINO|nr:unnamed protein product [Symbiodinium natans]
MAPKAKRVIKLHRKKVEISERTGKPKRIRHDRGAEAAKRQAKMTKEEWKRWQNPRVAKEWSRPEYVFEPRAANAIYVRDGGEGAYRDKTYEIVTRWTAQTQIRYRPHAKSPGSKSHLRYERYAKAKTIGQSLALGSKPIDWCYDFEHGFIKVVGGKVRDEPIDRSKIESDDELTAVDQAIMRWFIRELAKRYNLKVSDLRLEHGASESLMMRAHRLVANRRAKAILDKKRRISDDDVENVLQTWAFARNMGRLNVMPEGQDWVKSDTLGLLRDRMGSIHVTKPTSAYVSVAKMLNKWLQQRLPSAAASFKWTSINLNCNYAARRHRDANNFGPSFIQAFGSFTGGELSVWPEDDKSTGLSALPSYAKQTVDIKRNLVLFNGNTAHEVKPFKGERFSVVYFCCGCHPQTPRPVAKELKDLGFQLPSATEERHKLLSKPEGYGKKVTRVRKTVLKVFPAKK